MSAIIKRPVLPLLIFVLIATLAISACSPARQAASSGEADRGLYGGGGAPESAPMPAMEAPAAPQAAYDSSANGYNPSVVEEQVAAQDRVVIKNATLTIVVPDPAKSKANIFAMAEEMGGYVVSSNQYKEYVSNGAEVPHVSVTIRVPAARLDEVMSRIKAESNQDPVNENISSQDVTNEYVDLQSRLKNLEAAEAELTRIMQDANRTEDVLAVYQQLVSIREQIEVIKGQIKYYEQSAALSSLSIELIADAAVQPIKIGGWQPQGIAKDAVEDLVQILQGIGTVAIRLVITVIPVAAVLFVIFVLPVILLVRYLRRRSQARRQAVVATPPAE